MQGRGYLREGHGGWLTILNLNKNNMGGLIAKPDEDCLGVKLFATHVVQSVDLSYSAVLELPPGIPPHDPTANLCPLSEICSASTRRSLAWSGGFIAETEGNVVRGGWLQGLKAKPVPGLFL